MKPEQYALLASLQEECKKDPDFFSVAIGYMQKGVNNRIEELSRKVSAMECIAVAMHSKAKEKRHTQTSKDWVDRVIEKHKDVNHGMNIDWTEN